MKVHKGDTVLVISGKDKGAKGKVLEAYPTRDKVLVEGVNRIKKHTAVSQQRAWRLLRRHRHAGGRRSTCRNVMVVDSDGNPTRIGYRVDEETGKKVRVSKKNGKDI